MEPIAIIDGNTSMVHGITPLPRLLNHQLDSALEARIAVLEKEVLTELQTRIFKKQPLEWFGSFLTTYLLLSALERDTWSLYTWDHDSARMNERVAYLVSCAHPES